MIGQYFSLQFKLTGRWLRDAGIHPALAAVLFIGAFLLASVKLYDATRYADVIYILSAFGVAFYATSAKRNEFLETCFRRIPYLQVRFIENVILLFPFLVFLIFKQRFIALLSLLSIAVVLVFFRNNINLTYRIPTPFSRQPFEFAVGFRKTFYLLPVVYMLIIIGIAVNNYNLSVFAFVALFFILSGYYAQPENEYFVWIYNLTAKEFLMRKIKIALLYTSILVLPAAILLLFSFPHQIIFSVPVLIAGYLFLTCMILAKYGSYPEDIHLLHGIFIGAGVIFPPLLPVLILYFYRRSVNKLKVLLG